MEITMTATTAEELIRHEIVSPCEGGVPALGGEEVDALLGKLPGWAKVEGGTTHPPGVAGQELHGGDGVLQQGSPSLAEAEGHHPDLHLVGYRDVAIEVWTHAIGGLSENDFILAAKIDALPVLGEENLTNFRD